MTAAYREWSTELEGAIRNVGIANLPTHYGNYAGLMATLTALRRDLASAGITLPPMPVNLPSFGTGGVVSGPTLGLIGDRGPEAILPLTGLDALHAELYGLRQDQRRYAQQQPLLIALAVRDALQLQPR